MTAGVSIASGVGGFIAVAVFDAKFRAAGRDDLQQVSDTGLVWVTAWLASAAVGAVLLVRRPAHPVGWLFTALATTIDIAGVCEAYGLYGLFVQPGSLPGASAAAVVTNSIFIVAFVLLALVCSLTPDGQHLSSRWRNASRVMIGASILWIALRLVESEPLEEPFSTIENPWAVTSVDLGAFRAAAATLTNLLVLVAASSLIVRFRRVDGDARRQLLWIAVAAVPVPALMVLAFVSAYAGNNALVNLAAAGLVAVVPIGAGLAVTRYHLYEVDHILSRAVTYLLVTSLVVGTYVAVVFVVARAAGQAADRSPAATTMATLVAAAAARPVYTAVRDGIDRRFQRRRYEALRQVRALVADPSRDRDVEGVLRAALGDPSLQLAYPTADQFRWVTEHGRPIEVGASAVRVDRGGRTVAAATTSCQDASMLRTVLDEAAPELDNAGLRAAIAVQLEEVRESRERIAHVHVQERRRIERDLHDGAQQRLLGAAAQMQAALLNGRTERLRAALELGVRESRDAVADLRALAHGLHPAALTDGGLPAALDDLATRLPVSVVVSDPHRRYAAVVEATLWFVACEAATNATKHAAANSIIIRLDDLGGALRLVVEDDGCGGADQTGTGLLGLADRVEAAAGRLTITSRPGTGTRVEVVLPCES